MISQETTLVLGAGSSIHIGYPLGRTLVNQLCAMRGSSVLDTLPGWTRKEGEDMLESLSFSDSPSVDSFLERNRSYSALGKFLIALKLKGCEKIEAMFPPNDAGWYRYLFDSLLVDGEPLFGSNTLSIITFNYDRSLEAYVHTRLMHQFHMTDAQAFEALQDMTIIRPHGILGRFPDRPYYNQWKPEELLAISQDIRIIHEISDVSDDPKEFPNEAFKCAHDALIASKRVFFLGFGFHLDNIRRFQAFTTEILNDKQIDATSHGMGTRERQSLLQELIPFGFPIGMFHNTQCNEFFRFNVGLI